MTQPLPISDWHSRFKRPLGRMSGVVRTIYYARSQKLGTYGNHTKEMLVSTHKRGLQLRPESFADEENSQSCHWPR
jgi:hypothetical protein